MSDTLGRALRAFLPPVLVFVLLAGVLLTAGVPPAYAFVALVGVALLVVAGVGYTPHSRFAVGRRGRVTEGEVVRHVACDECGGDAVWGVRRGYRRELVLFGTPVWTLTTGENVYCRACSDDPSLRSVDESREQGRERNTETERA